MNHGPGSISWIKARTDLRAFLEEQAGANFERIGSGMRSNTCPCCGTGNHNSFRLVLLQGGEKWRCFACGARGDVLDAAMGLWGFSLTETLQRLRGHKPPKRKPVAITPEVKDETRLRAVRDVLIRIRAGVLTQGLHQQAVDYLANRGIPEKTIREGARRGLFGALPPDASEAIKWLDRIVGKDRLVKAGMWNPDRKAPAAAFRPLVFFLGEDSAEFRLMRRPNENERKSLRYGDAKQPWLWRGTQRTRAAVVEGPIDFLSMVALGYQGDVIGLPGVTVWNLAWFEGYEKVGLCLDPDKAGQEAAQVILKACRQANIPAWNRVLKPDQGDINDILMAKMRQRG